MNTKFLLIAFLTMLATLLVAVRLIIPSVNQNSSPKSSTANPFFKEKQITVGGAPVWVFWADTPQEITQGLSGTTQMGEDEGMLFELGERRIPSFWMKEMLFPLDLIWIDGNVVVDITENVPVPTSESLPTYSPEVPVNRVLEVHAGWVQRYGIEVGDVVSFN